MGGKGILLAPQQTETKVMHPRISQRVRNRDLRRGSGPDTRKYRGPPVAGSFLIYTKHGHELSFSRSSPSPAPSPVDTGEGIPQGGWAGVKKRNLYPQRVYSTAGFEKGLGHAEVWRAGVEYVYDFF